MGVERIIVLAAGALEEGGEFANFKDGMYLGGQVRLEAAVEVSRSAPGTQLTLVGGYNKVTEGDPQASNKVKDMASFILGQNPSAALQRVCSLPCTHHNFVAVFNHWAAAGVTVNQVGILTNGYHMARAEEFAARAAAASSQYAGVELVPLAAEEILERPIASIIGERHEEYAARLASESRGLEQLRAGTYDESCLAANAESLKPLLTLHGNALLAQYELARFQ